jgi:hypothetical protein
MERIMKRWTVWLLLGAAISTQLSLPGQAAERRADRRYQRGSFFESIVRTRNGQVVREQAHIGYKDGFPRPAWLYYGYPHSGDGSVSPWVTPPF